MPDQALNDRPSDRPDNADIRAAVEKIAASEQFRSAPQLVAFLRFVVDMEISGRGDRIKAYTIAVEALGRGEDFDPQRQPIVRVEAGRLRRTLEAYYAGPGRGDIVIIDVPRGGYVPTFRTNPPVMERLRKGGVRYRDIEASICLPLMQWLMTKLKGRIEWYRSAASQPRPEAGPSNASGAKFQPPDASEN
jgi:hypothetical protein